MATIYAAPEEIKVPKMDFANVQQWKKDEEKYIEELKAFCEECNSGGKNVGEIIRFPVADGHAEYMVASMKPVELIHIPLGDCWDFQYAHRLTAKDVQEKIDQQKRLAQLFSKKS